MTPPRCALSVVAVVLALAVCESRSEYAYFPLKTKVEMPSDNENNNVGAATVTKNAYISYVVEVQLGNPPQSHAFVVDTGSATLAVSGPNCHDLSSEGPCHNSLARYDPGTLGTLPAHC